MIDQLIVVVGAGASYDSTTYAPLDSQWQPPLVRQLFDERPPFTSILDLYPDAQSLAPDLRATVRAGAALGLEDYLRDHLLNSSLEYDRRRFRSIPLYLQHLLFECGRFFTRHPVNYDRLINSVLRRTHEAIFITLNYDTLLDRRLALNTPLDSLDSYVDPGRPWSLLKLHGSVNWMRRIVGVGNPTDQWLSGLVSQLGEGLQLDDEIVLRNYELVAETRVGSGELFYPALSVPLGEEDEFSCPEGHVSFLRKRLERSDGLDILVIGYSGIDSSVRRVLRESGSPLRSLAVVSESPEAAQGATDRLRACFTGDLPEPTHFTQGFNTLVAGSELDDYLDSLP